MPKKTKNPRPPAKMEDLVGKLMRCTRPLNMYFGYKGSGSGYTPGVLNSDQLFVVLRVIPRREVQLRKSKNKRVVVLCYDLEIIIAGEVCSAMLINMNINTKTLKEVMVSANDE